MALAPQTASYEILVEVYAIGSEMLFNADTLRSMREGKGEANLFDAVGKMLSSTSPSVLAVLPRVFESFIQATRKHRSSITVQVHHETSIDTSEHLRKVAMVFFSSCYACISQAGNVEDVWRARVALLQTVDSERLFSYQDHDAEGILMDNADMAYKSLASADRSSRALQRVAMEALTIITRIDYDLVAPVLPGLLPMMFIMVCHPALFHPPLLILIVGGGVGAGRALFVGTFARISHKDSDHAGLCAQPIIRIVPQGHFAASGSYLSQPLWWSGP